MSAATASRPQHISFSTPSDSLRQSTLKKNMSITQTYYLAHKARAKLSREAAQADHDLRLLVGHANLLDTLMVELADAEREQERWFNQSVRTAEKPQTQERHIQWAPTQHLNQVTEEDESEDESDFEDDESDDSDFYDEPDMAPLAPMPPSIKTTAVELSDDEEDDDDMMEDNLEEDYAQLELVRTPSHSSGSPPELVDDDLSDDESMPPSPPMPLAALAVDDKTDSKQRDDYNDYLVQGAQQVATAVAVC